MTRGIRISGENPVLKRVAYGFIAYCLIGMVYVGWRSIDVILSDGFLNAVFLGTPAARFAWLCQVLFFVVGWVWAMVLIGGIVIARAREMMGLEWRRHRESNPG